MLEVELAARAAMEGNDECGLMMVGHIGEGTVLIYSVAGIKTMHMVRNKVLI